MSAFISTNLVVRPTAGGSSANFKSGLGTRHSSKDNGGGTTARDRSLTLHRIVFVHSLRRFAESKRALEDEIRQAEERSRNGAVPVKVRVFSCDVEDIFERGETGFISAFTHFNDEMKKLLVRRLPRPRE